MQYMGVDTFVTLHEVPNKITELTYEVRDKDMNIIEKKTEKILIPPPRYGLLPNRILIKK